MKSNYYYKIEKDLGFDSVVMCYKDDDSKIEVKIAPKEGCNLYFFKYNDNEFISFNKELPLADFLQGNPVLFPFPNRIEDAMYTWKGKTYLQKKNGIPIQLHSLVYDEKTWEYEEPVINNENITLSCTLNIDEKHPIYRGYPFICTLTINFVLSGRGIELEYIVENKGEEEMPFGFATHPYFNRLDGDIDTKISVPANKFYEIRKDIEKEFLNKSQGGFKLMNNVMPTGKLLDVKKGSTDIRDETSVGDLNLDHVYTDINSGSFPIIDYSKRRIKLNIISSNDIKHYVVFVPKGRNIFCLEPQTCSTDAINLYNKGINYVNLLILDKGEIHTGKTEFIIEHY